MKRNVKMENDKTLPKTRKRRKPMTEEQKKAAGERLALARESHSYHPPLFLGSPEHPW